MEKEKFERFKPHANIGTIGTSEEFSKEKVKFAYSTIGSIFSDANEYNKSVLENLIEQYGEEEGKRRYDVLKKHAEERWEAIDRIDKSEEREGRSR